MVEFVERPWKTGADASQTHRKFGQKATVRDHPFQSSSGRPLAFPRRPPHAHNFHNSPRDILRGLHVGRRTSTYLVALHAVTGAHLPTAPFDVRVEN
jgi:hypothetical protein